MEILSLCDYVDLKVVLGHYIPFAVHSFRVCVCVIQLSTLKLSSNGTEGKRFASSQYSIVLVRSLASQIQAGCCWRGTPERSRWKAKEYHKVSVSCCVVYRLCRLGVVFFHEGVVYVDLLFHLVI